MKFSVVLPGQPPSANRQYKRRAGGLEMARRPEVTAYATMVTLLVREARPMGFLRASPGMIHEGQTRIVYDFYLGRPVDADNMVKIINDAIAQGLGVDDRSFLPCVRSLRTGFGKLARTEVEIEWPA